MSTHLADTLFHAARELHDAAERAAFLGQACDGDDALRARVEALLRADPSTLTASEPGLAQSAPLEKPGDTIGRYKLLQQIGEGGCGIVYMAEQSKPVRRKVALKVIKVGMDTKTVIARFEAERQALAMMDHLNIARVLDAGATTAGRPYFVMELVRGVPITKYCDENHLPAKQRLDLFMAVCHAIQHAHQKGIIHRDIKPSNILVTLHDGVPVPKVIDFGIAKATEARLTDLTLFTELHAFIGTPAYTSPEQAEMSGLDIDTRADIYSLGVLLYELLSGRLPFDPKALLKAGLDEMRRTIREVEPPRPSTRLSTLTDAERTIIARERGIEAAQLSTLLRGDLDWIVMKTLEKDRTRRYDTANGLASDIQRYLTNEPVLARPPSTAYVLRKLIRRRRNAFVAGAAVLATLIAGITVSSWQAVRATRAERVIGRERLTAVTERDRAQRAKQEATRAAQEARDQRQLAETARNQAEHQLSANLYASSMSLARAAWDHANIGRLREILEETRSYPDHGFEWYYWQRQIHLESSTLRGHKGPIQSVYISPDGQRIITGSEDKTAKLWDAETGRELLTLRGHAGAVKAVALSPDGRWILSGSEDNTARLWDAETGRELLTLNGHVRAISSVAISPDARRIATGSQDKTAIIWDAETGDQLISLQEFEHKQSGATTTKTEYGVTSVAFSPDGRRLITGRDSKKVPMTWDTTKEIAGDIIFEIPRPQKTSLENPSLLRLVAGPHGAVKFSLTGSTGNAESDGNPSASLGQTKASGKGGAPYKIANAWDTNTGRELLALDADKGAVSTVAFSSDLRQMVTGSPDGTLKIRDTETGRELLSIKAHADRVTAAAISSDGRRIVTGCNDNTAKLWDAQTGRELLTFEGHTDAVSSVAISADGRRVVTASADGTAKVWNAAVTGGSMDLDGIAGHAEPCIVSVVFSPDGRQITAKVLDAKTCDELLTTERNGSRGYSGAFSADAQQVVTLNADGTAKIWNAETGQEILALKWPTEAVSSIAISPGGARMLVVGVDGTAWIWDTATRRALLTLQGKVEGVSSMAFSTDGRRILTISAVGTAVVWDAETGRELLILKGYSGVVSGLAVSADGRKIVTGGYANTAKVWDAKTGLELLTLEGHAGTVSSLDISRDGRRIVTGSRDGKAKIWDAETGRELLTLKPGAERGLNVIFADRPLNIAWYGPPSIWTTASREEVEAWRQKEAADDSNAKASALIDSLDRAIEERNWDDAMEKLDEVKKPGFPADQRGDMNLREFHVLLGRKDFGKALSFAEIICSAYDSWPEFIGRFAWDIASAESVDRRSLEIAEKFANRANEAARGKDADILDTLARVLFMKGERETAIRTQENAMTLASETQKPGLQKALESYRKGVLPKPDFQAKVLAVIGRLDRAIEEKNWRDAEVKLKEVEKLAIPVNQLGDIDSRRFRVLLGKKDIGGAFGLAERICSAHQDNPGFLNAFARDTVKTDSADWHYLSIAEKFATYANEATRGKDPKILDTLARILFMGGKTEAAVRMQEDAMTLAPAPQKPGLQKTLESYRKGILPKSD